MHRRLGSACTGTKEQSHDLPVYHIYGYLVSMKSLVNADKEIHDENYRIAFNASISIFVFH